MKQSLKVAVIPGDGVGPEVIHEAQRIFKKVCSKASISLETETFPFSADEYLRSKRTLTDQDLSRFEKEFDAILFGALGDPRIPDNEHAREILLGLRFKLDLFINLRPVRLLREEFCPLKRKKPGDVSFVIFRENTEDVYRNMGGVFRQGKDTEIAIENVINTGYGVSRIIEAACLYAVDRKLSKVCMVDKSNVLRYGHGLWQQKWSEAKKKYASLDLAHLYIDAAAMEMIRAPEQFQVIVTTNMFGDILSDLGATLQGGMGMAASLNYRPHGPVLAEPVHGSAPALAGKNKANPMASILTVGMLMEHFGFKHEADEIENAVGQALDKKVITPDLGGTSTTQQVGDFIYERL